MCCICLPPALRATHNYCLMADVRRAPGDPSLVMSSTGMNDGGGRNTRRLSLPCTLTTAGEEQHGLWPPQLLPSVALRDLRQPTRPDKLDRSSPPVAGHVAPGVWPTGRHSRRAGVRPTLPPGSTTAGVYGSTEEQKGSYVTLRILNRLLIAWIRGAIPTVD